MRDYQELIKAIKARSNPENLELESYFQEELSKVTYGEVEKFVRFAMRGVEPEYTQRSKLAGERVRNHLETVLSEVSYEFQGSVMTNTHIIATSDIDLIVLSELFYCKDYYDIEKKLVKSRNTRPINYTRVELLEKAMQRNPFNGNSLQILYNNRILAEKKLHSEYMDCDTEKPKAIQITNRSLKRDVDIVIGSWFDNAETYLNGEDKDYRGVQVYNKGKHSQENPDFPFLRIKKINERNRETNHRLKKMIRFLKNLKAQLNRGSEEKKVSLSSFHINAICYDLKPEVYANLNIYHLVALLFRQLDNLCSNIAYKLSLKSVDGSEQVFQSGGDSQNDLLLLREAVKGVLIDLKSSGAL